MKLRMRLKVLGDLKSGTSQATGNPWKMRNAIFEIVDADGTQRMNVICFGDVCDQLNRAAVQVGDELDVVLWFNTVQGRNGYVHNEIRLSSFEFPTSQTSQS